MENSDLPFPLPPPPLPSPRITPIMSICLQAVVPDEIFPPAAAADVEASPNQFKVELGEGFEIMEGDYYMDITPAVENIMDITLEANKAIEIKPFLSSYPAESLEIDIVDEPMPSTSTHQIKKEGGERIINPIPTKEEIEEELLENDEEVDGIVSDLVQVTTVQGVQKLHEEAILTTGGFGRLLRCADGDDSDEADEYDEYDTDEEEEDFKGTGRAQRAKIRQTIKENHAQCLDGGRDIMDGMDLPMFEDEDVVDQLVNYRKMKADPRSKCPPPPPKKLRGGRKTLRKNNMDKEVPEDAVKIMCGSLGRKELRTESQVNVSFGKSWDGIEHMKMLTTTSFNCEPLMIQHQICSSYYQELKESVSLDTLAHIWPNAENVGEEYFEMALTNRNVIPMDKQIHIEHWNHAALCFGEGKELDPEKWPVEMAKNYDMNRNLFRSLKLKEQNPDLIFHYFKKGQSKARVKMGLMILHISKGIQALMEMNHRFTLILGAKERIQENLESLHEKLLTTDPKNDELSITGIRQVKMMLDAPYFKNNIGMSVPNFGETSLFKQDFMFRTDKQKWTQKDIIALKQCIKESLIDHTTQFLESRYQELCLKSLEKAEEELDAEGKCLEELAKPAMKRKRGRPTKAAVEQRDKYGVIYPAVCKIPGLDIEFRYKVTPKSLGDWRTTRERRLRGMGFDNLIRELISHVEINWDDVAEKIMLKTRKWRTPEDCELCFEHEIDPKINSKRWTLDETVRLKTLTQNKDELNNDWNIIAEEMHQGAIGDARKQQDHDKKNPKGKKRFSGNRGRPVGQQQKKTFRTTYQCFFRYRNRICPPARVEWDEEMDEELKDLMEMYPAEWRKIAMKFNRDEISKRVVVERYKKNLNPMLRTGAFTRVEDALLILTIERLKPFLLAEGHFGCLLAYLPWRYETTWRDRANNLFNDWIVPWTLEEDERLLELAEQYKRNWQKISEQFSSFKNRKGCLTRFKILMRNLKDPRFKSNDRRTSLEMYHEAYAMTRYNVFQYRHLKEVLALIERVISQTKVDLSKYPFEQLDKEKEPSEEELRHMLLCFDKEVMTSAIKSLKGYIHSRDAYWEQWTNKYGNRKRTFDRRTFHKDNPQSVASALHIRGLKLHPQENFQDLNDFEKEIYIFYNRFCRTKALKKDAIRPYLPHPVALIQWHQISRIIATKADSVDNFMGKFNSKWAKKGSKAKREKKSSGRGRPPKNPISNESSSEEEEEDEEEEEGMTSEDDASTDYSDDN